MADLAATVEELREDREHGASWMARRTVEAMLEVAEQPFASCEAVIDDLVEAARQLAESRPSIGAIPGAAGRVLAAASSWRHLPVDEFRQLLRDEGQAILDARVRAGASIAIHLADRLNGATVATLSASSTVREALLHTPPQKVICAASEPVGEGRAFAQDLREEGLEVDLVEDAEAPRAVKE